MKKGWNYDQTAALVKLTATYMQHSDSESNEDIDQELIVSTENASTDEPYFVIKTERWAFDNLSDLIDLLNDFKNRYDL